MSDAELSRWIAEKLEPKPAPQKYSSNKFKYWLFDSPCGESQAIVDCRPRDMVNDPAMLKMMTGLPGFISLDHVSDVEDGSFYEASFCGAETHSPDCGAKIETAQHPTEPQKATALAFYKANGGTPTAKESEAGS